MEEGGGRRAAGGRMAAGESTISASYFPTSYLFASRSILQIIISFAWVAGVSYLISSIISRWSVLLGAPTIILGMTLVTLGAEIPDIIQSVKAAQRGYGSLAVSNCIGSKIVNIGLGFGLPWLVSVAIGKGSPLQVCGHDELQAAAIFHASGIVLFMLASLVAALIFHQPKARLSWRKGAALLGSYLLALGGYILYYYVS